MKNFIVKVAKKDLTEKEIERFKQEFIVTKQLNSPYIVEVYSYNLEKQEYYKGFMSNSLYE